eukprot:NODE_1041_length_2490_cov_1.026767.p3 type:complete len:110 gc:universal NODE_1041_length_2490_cov_1.026767:1872-1543(-)
MRQSKFTKSIPNSTDMISNPINWQSQVIPNLFNASISQTTMMLLLLLSIFAKRCGKVFGKCTGKDICSKYGYCGHTAEYQPGCQVKYSPKGLCNPASAPSDTCRVENVC